MNNKNIIKKVSLEASSICQLKCEVCPTAKKQNGIVGSGFLKYRNFKEFIKNNKFIEKIELSNWGEIFLNPEIDKIMKLAYVNKIHLSAGNGTNLNTIKEKTIENLVKYSFHHLSISLDGASQETYRIYRKGGDYLNVINNIEKINFYKKKYKSKYPVLYWQYIVFGHNENEITKAEEKAKNLNMIFKIKLNCDEGYSPIRNKKLFRKINPYGVASRTEYSKRHNKEFFIPCYQLWTSPQINWDGKLLGCRINTYGDVTLS
jgi:MoaA/NifB/PqqE/SkfB family radical SAM enzyme